MALLCPEHVHEKTLMMFALFIGTLLDRISADTVEDKPCPEVCSIIFRTLLTGLLRTDSSE